MFTGIIEEFGTVVGLKPQGNNLRIKIESALASELKIDQSVAHDGVCLTIVALGSDWYEVDAIAETLLKTNLSTWRIGHKINLERAMLAGARLDGHMVQGHVDTVATCLTIEDMNESWLFTFELRDDAQVLMVDKGSICVNGISLTLVSPKDRLFSVAIIPYTYEHTNLHTLCIGDTVNIEFDILGKYIQKSIKAHLDALSLQISNTSFTSQLYYNGTNI